MPKHMVNGEQLTIRYAEGDVVYARCRVIGITKFADSKQPSMLVQPCDRRGNMVGDKLLMVAIEDDGSSIPVVTASEMMEAMRGQAQQRQG